MLAKFRGLAEDFVISVDFLKLLKVWLLPNSDVRRKPRRKLLSLGKAFWIELFRPPSGSGDSTDFIPDDVIGKAFEIQVSGQRIYIPPDAEIDFEYERTENVHELEVEIKWKSK